MDGGAVIPVGEISFEIIGHGLCSIKKAGIAAGL
jgi:hypothetical protein